MIASYLVFKERCFREPRYLSNLGGIVNGVSHFIFYFLNFGRWTALEHVFYEGKLPLYRGFQRRFYNAYGRGACRSKFNPNVLKNEAFGRPEARRCACEWPS